MKRLSLEPLVLEGASLVNTSLGIYVEIGELSVIENSRLDDFSYCGRLCILQNARIAKFSNIAASVRLGPTMHPFDRPTLHHFTYRPALYGFGEDERDEEFFKERESRLCFVGNDTWIGHAAIVMPGVTIGDGAVVGSGAVVTHDVPPFAIAAGVPARVIGERFPDALACEMTSIAWWDWDAETIKTRKDDFRLAPEAFVEKYRRALP
jgi:phosphonate metabolism protein (transferase hexapeptide repeat family)